MEMNTVLLVEDNPTNRKLCTSLLEILDCRVIEAEDAEKGLDLARENNPDLILMDIHLPGMNGYEAVEVIRNDEVLADIPVIAVTAMAAQDDWEGALDAGCTDYISKPIDTRMFLEKVSQYLGGETGRIVHVTEKAMESRKKVLVVDDDAINVKIIEAMLPLEEYEVIKAYSGSDALKAARTESPSLILLDIMMPDMDGYEVTRILKSDEETKDIPIVMVTALDGKADRMMGLDMGAEDVLVKPVNRFELLARVKSMVRLREYQRQLSVRTQAAKYFSMSHVFDGMSVERESLPSILLVEDNQQDADLVFSYLSGDRSYRIHRVQSGKDALDYLASEDVDLILLDVLLPDIDGLKLLEGLKASEDTRNIQVVIITAISDLEKKVEGIEMGADDYLIKPINERELKARTDVLIRKKIYLDRLRMSYELALDSAMKDGLTGLYNQSYLARFLDLELKRARRHKYPVSLVMMDIDNFKEYNTRFGHLVGDLVLREVSKVMRESFREIDLVARYGGDEFCIVLPYCDEKGCRIIAERVRAAINSHAFPQKDGVVSGSVSVSLGTATFPEMAQMPEDLIKRADVMLFKDKESREGAENPPESGGEQMKC